MKFKPIHFDITVVILLLISSWGIYRLLGMFFDPTPLNGYFQFIDIILLQTRLVESLIFYHGSPPMLNLFTGVGLKIFGHHYLLFFSFAYHLMGALLAMSFMLLVRHLTANRILALIATAFLVFSPALVLYQNWLMYTFPTATLITFSVYALLKVTRTSSYVWLHIFFATLGLLVMTRSLFHLGWFALVIAIALWLLPALRSKVIIACIAPLLICTLWYGKNQLLFDNFGSSTWLGLGLSNITTLTVSKDDLQPHVDSGRLSTLALSSRKEKEGTIFTTESTPTGIAVLDHPSTSLGVNNFNYALMPSFNKVLIKDASTIIRLFPFDYLSAVIDSNKLFFSTNSVSPFFRTEAKQAFHGIRTAYDLLFYGAGWSSNKVSVPLFGEYRDFSLVSNFGYTTFFLWITSIAYALVFFFRGYRQRNRDRDYIVIGYIAFVMLYIQGISTTVEYSENYRYRFLAEPISWVLITVMISNCVQGAIRIPRNAEP